MICEPIAPLLLCLIGSDEIRLVAPNADRCRDALEAADNNVTRVPRVPGDAAWSNRLV